MEELLTFREAQKLLKVSRSTMYRLIRSGLLPVARLGPRSPRFRKEDLEAMLRASMEGERG
ncbi:MAG: helix-turn-helix domain-containing protein [Bacillota bacterium]|nr:helix-turn-helix domain-containing protein [Bacillota bacterium]